MNSLEYINPILMKSQSEELSQKNNISFHDIGIKLFPGVFQYNKKKSYEHNNYNNNFGEIFNNDEIKNNKKDVIKIKNDLECNNYLCKNNFNKNKTEQKKGLALAFDYYSSFLEDKKILIK